jgi:putative ABC transport system permease protein
VKLRTVAFSNLKRRKSRAAFLVAGLLVGIGTVVALLTLSQALTVQAQNNLETYGANILVVPRTDALSLTYGGVTLGTAATGSRDIRQADLERISTIANRRNIAIIAPELLGAVKVAGKDGLLMGVRPKDEFDLKKWWSVDGRPPRNGDEVVAGSAAARSLHLKTGDSVSIGGKAFTVTGVLRPTGSEDDNLLITDLGAAQTLLGKPGKVSMVQIAALCSNCPVEKIVAQVGGVLPGTKVTAMQQQVKNRMHAIDQFRTFSWIVAGVIIGIEALVVFVTMMGSVNERTREIGIFRALGFRRLHVTGLILIEAVVASLLAGVLGYLAGMGVSYALLPVLAGSGAADGVTVTWAPALAAGAVGLAVAIGAVASLYPALRASRMDPTVALRAL